MSDFMLQVLYNFAVIGLSAYLIAQLAPFRRTINHQASSWRDRGFLILVFGLLSVLGNGLGIPLHGSMANNRIVGPIVGGLLGGPIVGMGAGLIGAIPRYFMGGYTMEAAVISNIIIGLWSGYVHLHYRPRRITLSIALKTALISEFILKSLVLLLSEPFEAAWELEKFIAIPTIISNSLASCLFLYIVQDIFSEQEKIQARSAQQAMRVIHQSGHILHQGLTPAAASALVDILYQEFHPAAVAVTDATHILAFQGLGSDHHLRGQPILTLATKEARRTGQPVIASTRDEIGCPHENCPLTSVIDAPLLVNGEFFGSVKIFQSSQQKILPHESELIQGIADFLSSQLAYSQLTQQARLLEQAEYNLLRAQVNPHFLFNTLATIRVLVRTDGETARHRLKDLSDFLRSTLVQNQDYVSLHQEMETVSRYVRLEKARFGERLQLHVDIANDLLIFPIPTFTLQPLVENSIKHGLTPKKDGGAIHISAKKSSDYLQITVNDNGVGFQPSSPLPPEIQGAGIGLSNIRKRLHLLYGPRASLQIQSHPDAGTKAMLQIPLHWEKTTPADLQGGTPHEHLPSTYC